jgi:hypothetical protein
VIQNRQKSIEVDIRSLQPIDEHGKEYQYMKF